MVDFTPLPAQVARHRGEIFDAYHRPLDRRRSGGATASRMHQVWNPSTGEVQAEVALGDAALLERAVDAAKKVQPEWAATNPQKRARIMFAFKELIEKPTSRSSPSCWPRTRQGGRRRQGRRAARAGGDRIRLRHPAGAEGRVHAWARARGSTSIRCAQPLGIGAGITPFNFPAMIPMWMFGMAIAAGNAFILKPSRTRSERAGASRRAVPRSRRARGAAAGGARRQGNGRRDPRPSRYRRGQLRRLVRHRALRLPRGVAAGKRVQAMGGAKNHGIVMPDADLDQVVNDLAGAAFGSAGERCMALPVVVPVGEDTADRLREKLIPAINALRIGRLERQGRALRPRRHAGAQGARRAVDRPPPRKKVAKS